MCVDSRAPLQNYNQNMRQITSTVVDLYNVNSLADMQLERCLSRQMNATPSLQTRRINETAAVKFGRTKTPLEISFSLETDNM
jgi:hypothetical protein